MKLYLSRILLNPRSRRAMSEMLHPYEMHRTVMHAFSKNGGGDIVVSRKEFKVLFRTEAAIKIGDPVKILVQSIIEPDWSYLNHIDGYLDTRAENPWEYKNIMPALNKINEGEQFAFRLRANPTKRIGNDEDPQKGKRVQLQREEEQIQWLIRKANNCDRGHSGGFKLLMEGSGSGGCCSVRAISEGKRTGRKGGKDEKNIITHFSVLFEGLLEVTDKDVFVQTLISGIGSAKAFGFGLLSLAPKRIITTE